MHWIGISWQGIVALCIFGAVVLLAIVLEVIQYILTRSKKEKDE